MSEFDAALDTFAQEVDDLLTAMETALLGLEDAPGNEAYINSVFRAMHTIKGSSGLFGFDAVVDFAHQAETVLDQVRHGSVKIDSDLISILLECKDHTAKLVNHFLNDENNTMPAALTQQSQQLIALLANKSTSDTLPTTSHSATQEQLVSKNHSEVTSANWLISLEFKQDALRNGIDPLSFIRYLTTLGDIVAILTYAPNLPTAEQMDPEDCYLNFKIAFNSNADKKAIEEVFEFAEDDCDINILPPHAKIEHYQKLLEEQPEDHVQRLGQMLITIGALTEKEVSRALHKQTGIHVQQGQKQKPIGEILVENKMIQQPIVEQALKKQQSVKQKVANEANYIRIDSGKLGDLINLVGELVISGAAMQMKVDQYGLIDVLDVSSGMNHLINEIRDTALQLRMVQIGETFSRFRRIVRNASKDLGKEVELIITGGDTELDKTVIEKINDPLMHLIRNALDHGIETPEVRKQAGKPEKGTIHLNAYHDSGHIEIQINDDGRGLDPEKIRAKAIENKLIKENQHLSRQEIFNLIFEPGLSTKEQADNFSGRGVGMDVVRRNIEALRGIVEIDSTPGQGASITVQLPLTLAIIDGFMVEVAEERYIIPLSMVEECVEMDNKAWSINETRHYINLHDQVLPYLRLREFFNHQQQPQSKRESMVVVRFGKARAGFVVDQLHGEHQTVIKPLGKVFQKLQGVSGATVLGNGDVALILDVQGLIDQALINRRRNPNILPATTTTALEK